MKVLDSTSVCDFEGRGWRIVINSLGEQGPQNKFNVVLMRQLDSGAYHAQGVHISLFEKLAEGIDRLPAGSLRPASRFSQRDVLRHRSYEGITLYEDSRFRVSLQLTRRKGKVVEQEFCVCCSADPFTPVLLAAGDEIQELIKMIAAARYRVAAAKKLPNKLLYEYKIGKVLGTIREPETIDPDLPYEEQLLVSTRDIEYAIMGAGHYPQFEEHNELVLKRLAQYVEDHFGDGE